MNRRQIAEHVAYTWDGQIGLKLNHDDGHLLIDAIEAALRERDERAVKIIQEIDLTDWVKDGGRLRDVFAAAILDEDALTPEQEAGRRG